jgi:NAD(P)-dependent dehydrogenase (short-subunit alcohol dehydrogenase family)
MSQIWLITGCSRGLGRAIAEAVLAAEHKLVATARNPKQLDNLVEHYGDRVFPIALDVTDKQAAGNAIKAAVDAFGRLDIFVNNKGYGDIALDRPPVRLLLGSDAVHAVEQSDIVRMEADRKWRDLSLFTDFESMDKKQPESIQF